MSLLSAFDSEFDVNLSKNSWSGQAEGYDMTQPSLREALEDQIHTQKNKKAEQTRVYKICCLVKVGICQREVDFRKGILEAPVNSTEVERLKKEDADVKFRRHSKGAWMVCSNADFSPLFRGVLWLWQDYIATGKGNLEAILEGP